MTVKNILVTGTTFPRWEGDTEPSFVYELSGLLAKRGFDVIALTPHHKGAASREIMGSVKIRRFPYFFAKYEKLCYDGGMLPNMKKYWYAKFLMPLLIISEFFYALRIVRKAKIDAMHAHWIVPQGFVAAIIKKLTGTPYIVTAHAGDVFPLKNKFLKWFGKIALKNAAYTTVNSNATKQAVLEVAKVPVEIIPMGVDLAAFSPDKRKKGIREKYGVSGEFIFTVGRMAEKKGFKYLIAAMPKILKKLPKAKLVLIGDGPERPGLEQLTKELKLENNVLFAGKVTHKELENWYPTADVFVLPSIVTKEGDTEGLGVVFLEAIASGTPVIGSNVGGIPDIIMHEKTGLLVPEKAPDELADAIVRVLSDKKLNKKLTENAFAFVKERFTWNLVADRFAGLFRKTGREQGQQSF
ncbi:glycosyltransferase [Candidatus Woesearchaeota archaeon]|nr:glycosyltransferase [Candidatus Woesearchaeota archaeon]